LVLLLLSHSSSSCSQRRCWATKSRIDESILVCLRLLLCIG
jgi:hypothetical protein